jgi:hypothetical protein
MLRWLHADLCMIHQPLLDAWDILWSLGSQAV